MDLHNDMEIDELELEDEDLGEEPGTGSFSSPALMSDDLRRFAHAVEAPPAASSAAVFLGECPAMREAARIVKVAARSSAPVLILGETGSGKEVVARELHNRSPRAHHPFVKLNCAALPSELVESELFGYERGAFTGAFQRKLGMFELADKGTILLDEIGDMDVRLQAKLLQVLQDKEFKRLGGRDTIRVDVRVIAATHRDLEQAIAQGDFRQDLYYRLNVVSIHLPPLRERGDDVLHLAELLLKRHSSGGGGAASLPVELRHALLAYDWPGNVRELDNVMQRFSLFGEPEMIVRGLSPKRRPAQSAASSSDEAAAEAPVPKPLSRYQPPPTLDEVAKARDHAESEAILAALNATRWNRKRAARMLNIDYKALLYRMKKLSLEKPGVDVH